MKMIFVLEFDIPAPECVVDILKSIDPPNLPHFVGAVRIAIADDAQHVLDWLDEEK